MASEGPPSYPQTGDQPQDDDSPPTYDDATGILDVRHGGISTQTRVGGQLYTLILLPTCTD